IFSPSNITANVGDVVSFAFLTKNHSVTQSSFASPCEPLARGVDSGFQSVAANATNVHEFSIAINNASKPLFSSRHKRPVNECQRGMVFSINQAPNSAKSFAAFQAAAVTSAAATGAASATPSAAAKSSGSDILSFADFQANAEADVLPAKTGAATASAAPASATSAASNILVLVGANNSDIFSPSNISAKVGDVVTFQFVSKNHSVTQTSFAKPCSALLAGGVDSGFQPALLNAPAFPTFSFTVNNASTPLFFTSTQAAIASECNKGMVFSINQDPNSAVKSFADFLANAEVDILPAVKASKQGRRMHARDFANAARR
ncbi:hypothetical protein B0H13DRAFT_1636817, partial [Mycena leptocephala]